MEALRVIIWFLGFLAAMGLVYETVKMRVYTEFYPKTKRRWHLVACIFVMLVFGFVVLNQPFGYYAPL